MLPVILGLMLLLSGSWAAPSGFIGSTNYIQGENLEFSGSISSTSVTTVNATITNATGLVKYVEVISTGGSSNTFSGSMTIDFAPGDYNFAMDDGIGQTTMNFSVVSDRLNYLASTVEILSNGIFVNTSNTRSLDDLDNFAKSIAHYGNASINGTLYHFGIIDSYSAGKYDEVYVDDDPVFQLYNNSEDGPTNPALERQMKEWETLNAYTLMDVAPNGKYLIFAKPSKKQFSPGDTLKFLLAVKGSDGLLKKNQPLGVSLVYSNGTVLNSTVTTTTQNYTASVLFPVSTSGDYFLTINNTVVSSVSVQSFRLIPKVSDESGTPQFTFSKDPIVRVGVAAKTASGNALTLSSLSATIYGPDGSKTVVSSLTENPKGNYYYETDFSGNPVGSYSVEFQGKYGGETRKVTTGFEIKSRAMELMAINIKLMDSVDQEGATPNFFAPQSNITMAVFFSDLEGGGMAGPPESWSLVPLDNTTTGKRCSDLVKIESVKNTKSKGINVNYSVMNISSMAALEGAVGPNGPPTKLLDQCGIVIWANNSLKTDTYVLKASLTYGGQKYTASDTFGVQDYYGFGYPSDISGNENWFMSPNSTGYMRVLIKDLQNDTEINKVFVNDVTITGMRQVYPTEKDVFNASKINATYDYQTGVVSFNTPLSEGFFELEFRFSINDTIRGKEEVGIGKGFLDIKKYIIMAEPVNNPVAYGENVTLTVKVYDVSQGAYLDYRSGTCTGCSGLTVNITRIFSQDSFSPLNPSKYTVLTGTILNSTNPETNVTIAVNPLDILETGSYGVDILLTDSSGETYFGWGWFEVRNFYVDVMTGTGNSTTVNVAFNPSYGKGESIYLVPTAWDPQTNMPTSITSMSVKRVQKMDNIPTPVSFTSQELLRTIIMPDDSFTSVQNVLKISGMNEEGNYEAIVEVHTPLGVDKGRAQFQISSYFVDSKYRNPDGFGPPLYDSQENLTIQFTAYEADRITSHNFSISDCAVPRFAYKRGTRDGIKLSNFPRQVSQSSNQCNVSFSLISLNEGEFSINFLLKDTNNATHEEEVFIKVGGATFEVAKQHEIYLWNTQTPKTTLYLENAYDMCSNVLSLQNQAGTKNYQAFLIFSGGMWGVSGPQDSLNVTSNGTVVSIYEAGTPQLINGTVGSTFKLFNSTSFVNFSIDGNKFWEITGISLNQVSIREANGSICGSFMNETSMDMSPQYYSFISPNGITKGYHGYVSFTDLWSWSIPSPRYDYVFTNGTHVWVNITNDLNHTSPVPLYGTIQDGYGGKWQVKEITDKQIVFEGLNVLPNGMELNLSLSGSKVIITGQLQEQSLGGFDQSQNMFTGIDLNGNGNTTDTLKIALIDNGSTKYNTLAYSNISFGNQGDSSLNNTIYLNAKNPYDRQLGNQFIMSSVGPKNKVVRFYALDSGDWSFLGQFRNQDIVRVPVLLKYPNGTGIKDANVTITKLLKESPSGRSPITLLGPLPNATSDVNGLVEINFNLTKYSIGSGRYFVALDASLPNGNTISLEEWKWPNFEVSNFIYDIYQGKALYVGSPQNATLNRYRNDARHLFNVNSTNLLMSYPNTNGVLMWLDSSTSVNMSSCLGYTEPTTAGSGENHTYNFEKVYVFESIANQSMLWVSNGDCNFSNGILVAEGDQTNFDLGRNYTLQVLNATMNFTAIGVDVSSFIPVSVSPFRGSISKDWYLSALTGSYNISGTDYMVLFPGSSEQFPLCTAWNENSCAKEAVFSINSSFAGLTAVRVGENFTKDLYLSSIGPSVNGEIVIANYSTSQIKPALDTFTADNNKVEIFTANETILGQNLDGMNGDKTYYIVLSDSDKNNNNDFTNIVVDDDLNITQSWWEENSGTKLDFYGNESGSPENMGDMPSNYWSGYINFNESGEGWQVLTLSERGLLLQKFSWNMLPNQNVSFVIKLFDFDQNPIPSGTLNVTDVYKFGYSGFGNLIKDTDYRLYDSTNVTDSKGYGVITLESIGNWTRGDYSVKILANTTKGTQPMEAWFHVD